MTTLRQQVSVRPHASVRVTDAPNAWVVPSLLFALAAVAGWRGGGFWHAEAAAIALIAGVLLVATLITAPPDRRGAVVIGGLGLLALWWCIRSVTAGPGTDFLPLGASIIAFAAAFAAVRPLVGRRRELAALAVACLGAMGALFGLAGLIWRWFPMAMPAQGLWRLSSSLTYADAAGLACGVCLLLALGCDRWPAVVRMAVCLNVAGLIATQSRGAAVAVAAACLLVPARRYRELALPLITGVGLGIAAVASSPQRHPVPWLAAVVVGAVIIALGDRPEARRKWSRRHAKALKALVGGALLAGIIGVALLLRHEIDLRALAPSDQDRSAEWSSAWRQWASAPLTGVGPDRGLVLHAADGSFAHFAHNEYLQVAADSGVVGVGLLAFVGLSLARVLRRVDPLSSCAVAAVVCWAVGGLFDFSWHLPVLGLLGGWSAGLAAPGDRH